MNFTTSRLTLSSASALVMLACLAASIPAKAGSAGPAPTSAPMKHASELINKQDPPKVVPRLMDTATPDNTHVIVSLSKQRAYLLVGDEIALDTPISSGKRAGMTPNGNFKVLEKDPNHFSNIFGSFVDSGGRTVRGGVSLKIDSAPSGTHYVGAPMKWFMRLTEDGVGMHVGILPGYAASHGCVRLPADIAPLIYAKVKVGTPVEIDP
ncbi:MAG: L,D-transpeptidase family protein [Chthoniobacteraceae bacterium]